MAVCTLRNTRVQHRPILLARPYGTAIILDRSRGASPASLTASSISRRSTGPGMGIARWVQFCQWSQAPSQRHEHLGVVVLGGPRHRQPARDVHEDPPLRGRSVRQD